MSFENIFDLIQQFGMPLLFAAIYFISQFFSKGKGQDEKDPTRDPMDQAEMEEFKRKAKEQLDRYLNQKKEGPPKQRNTLEQHSAENSKRLQPKPQPEQPEKTVYQEQYNQQDSNAYGLDALEKMREQIRETQKQADGYRKAAFTKQKEAGFSAYNTTPRPQSNSLRPDFSNGSLKQAIILSEVLGRPKALR